MRALCPAAKQKGLILPRSRDHRRVSDTGVGPESAAPNQDEPEPRDTEEDDVEELKKDGLQAGDEEAARQRFRESRLEAEPKDVLETIEKGLANDSRLTGALTKHDRDWISVIHHSQLTGGETE
jgi:hypothetical protein